MTSGQKLVEISYWDAYWRYHFEACVRILKSTSVMGNNCCFQVYISEVYNIVFYRERYCLSTQTPT